MKLKGLIVGLFVLAFASAQTEIQYWDWWVTQEPAVQAIIAAFEAAHPDIKVVKTLTATTSYKETLNAAIQSGNAPDVFLIPTDPGFFLDYANQGYLYDLNQFPDAEDFKAAFPNPASNFVEGSNIIGGKFYSAPFSGPDKPWLQLYVNTALYKEAGLVDADGNPTMPVTWEDFVNNSRTIKEKTGKAGLGFSMQQSWAAAWALRTCNYSGSPLDGFLDAFDWRTGQYTYSTNPCYKQVLTDLLEMSKDGTIDDGTMSASYDDEGARAKFAENGFAHLFAGEWVIPGFSQTHPDFSEFTATHLPFINGEPQSYFGGGVGGIGLGINAESENPEAAWELFKFFHTPEAAKIWSENGQGLALQTPKPYDDYATNDAFKYIFNSGDLTRIYPEPALRNPNVAALQITLLGTSTDDLFAQILTGQVTDIDAALADLDKRKSEALDLAISDAQAAGLEVSREDFVFPDWNPLESYQN
jgi:ABC-type glycerol-3-phosphate transport system substrate-binding protein